MSDDKVINRKKIGALQSLRLFFAMVVMAQHIPPYDEYLSQIGNVGVSFFFILSGWLAVYTDTSNLKNYYKKKILRIFPMLWFSLVIALIANITVKSCWTVDNAIYIIRTAFCVQSYFPTPMGYYYYANSPAWFLCTIVLFYLILPAIQKFCKKSIKFFVSLVAAYSTIVVCITAIANFNLWIQYSFPFVRLMDCLWGMVAATLLADKQWRTYHQYFSFLLVLLYLFFGRYIIRELSSTYLLMPLMIYLISVFATATTGWFYNVLNNKVFQEGGNMSMELFLFHFPLMRIVSAIVYLLDKYLLLTIPKLVSYLLVWLIVFLFSYAYHKIINPRITKVL